MNYAAPDGGGGSAPVIEQIKPLFTELLDLLGQLAGNESAYDYLQTVTKEDLPDGWSFETSMFSFPGPHGFELVWSYPALGVPESAEDPSGKTNADRIDDQQQAIDTTWNSNHDSWADSALDVVYRASCQNVWEPDPGIMAASADQLGEVTRFLNSQTFSDAGWVGGGADAPDWLPRLRSSWPATSHSSASFYDFWNDVNEKCALYVNVAARLASTSARVAATVSDFQTSLYDTVKAARDQAKLAVKQWETWKQPSGSWPTGETEENKAKAALEWTSYASGVVSLWGPAAVVAGPVGLVTGTLALIVPSERKLTVAAQAATASEIHQGLLDDLAEVETGMKNVLDALRGDAPGDDSATGGQSLHSLAGEVRDSRRDWSPPDVRL